MPKISTANDPLRNREWLKSRIDAGKSQQEIADELGIPKGSIGYYVHMHGLQSSLEKPERVRQALKRKYPNGRNGPLAANWRGGRRSTKGKKPGGYIRIYMPTSSSDEGLRL